VRVQVRVKPGSSRVRVGGRHDEALVVAVTARAVDGKATQACLQAVAEAFGVPSRRVRLLSGATSRTKLLEIELDETAGATRLAELLGPSE
jgi:uncharacterized protein YggU (UPF0235/DUF167 family)